jgi:hypothetical protein
MELGKLIWDFFQLSRNEIYNPIVFSFVILAVCASLAFYFRDESLRIALIILLALFFYWLSADEQASIFGQEYFLNMSTELLGTIISLIVFASVMTANGWTFPVVAMIVVTMISVLTIRTDDFNNGFSLNMSTELFGAFLTTVLLNRDWLWAKGSDKSGSLLSPFAEWIEKRVQKQHTFSVKTSSKADYYVLIVGENEVDVADKVAWLTRSGVVVVSQSYMTHDTENKRVYQEIGLAMDTYEKQAETVTLSNQEARIRVLAYPDTAYRIHQQMTEMLECNEPKHVSTPDKELTHLEFTVQRPRFLFSDYIEKQLNLLVREWRNQPDECLVVAATHLMDWAVTMNFIKGRMND